MSEAKHYFVSHLQAAITLFIAAFLRELDRECQRSPAYPISSTGGRSCSDSTEIYVEIEVFLRAELLKILPCDWWGEETGHVPTGNPSCWVIDL